MADIEQQARELLAAEYWRVGSTDAARDLRANRMDQRLGWVREANIALRAIARALRTKPTTLATVKPPRDRRTRLREDV